MSETAIHPQADGVIDAVRSKRWEWITDHKWLIAIFTLLIIGAAAVRLLTFDRYLPNLDYADENNMYLMGRDWRGVEDVPVVPEWLAGYPPLYIWINIGVQQTVEALWTKPWLLISDYFFYLRLLAAIAGIATTLLIVSIGWQLAGSLGGWLAGFIWALSPIVVEFNSLAIPDPMVYLTCAASICLALYAWHHQSPRALFAGFLIAIAAVYLKYPAFYVFIPSGLVGLGLLYRQPRKTLPWIMAMLVVGALAGAYLVFGYGSLRLSNREADTVRSNFMENMLDLNRNFNNVYYAILPIGMAIFIAGMMGGFVGYLYNNRKGRWTVNLWPTAILAVYSVVGIMVTSTYSNVGLGGGKIRHVLPVSVAVMVMWGVAVTQLIRAVQGWLAAREPESRGSRPVGLVTKGIVAGIVAVFGVALVPGYAAGNVGLIQRFSQMSIQERLWRWSDVDIPADGIILGHPESHVIHSWNRPWSGYDGVKTFHWWLEDEKQMAASSPKIYAERGITYFVMDEFDKTKFYTSPAMQAFIDQLTLVKFIRAPQGLNQYDAYFYRMLPPQHTENALFGGQIALVGYDLNATTFAPNETITLRVYWKAPQHPATNYSMFVHLYPQDEIKVLAQYDGAPTVSERPTLTWDDPNELYIGSEIKLSIPAATPPGSYRVAIGLYDYGQGVRLTLPDGDYKFTIPVTVK